MKQLSVVSYKVVQYSLSSPAAAFVSIVKQIFVFVCVFLVITWHVFVMFFTFESVLNKTEVYLYIYQILSLVFTRQKYCLTLTLCNLTKPVKCGLLFGGKTAVIGTKYHQGLLMSSMQYNNNNSNNNNNNFLWLDSDIIQVLMRMPRRMLNRPSDTQENQLEIKYSFTIPSLIL